METYKELHTVPVAPAAVWGANKVRVAANERLTPEQQYLYDCVVVDIDTSQGMPSDEALLESVRQKCMEQIEAYDQSAEVNTFYLNGQAHWLDFETRDKVYQGNERLRRMGRTETTLWLDGECYTLPIDTAQDFISKIEVYAKGCYNVTQEHMAKVCELKSLEEIMAFDLKADYPPKTSVVI